MGAEEYYRLGSVMQVETTQVSRSVETQLFLFLFPTPQALVLESIIISITLFFAILLAFLMPFR